MATEQSIKANNIVTLPEGEASALSLATADIKGMTVTDTGELVITLQSGDTLTITNFESLAAQGVLLNLADGGTIETRSLFEKLVQDLPAKDIGTPAANTVVTYDLLQGRTYKFTFENVDVDTVEQKDGALIVTFENGGRIVLNGYDNALDGDIAPELSFNGEFLSVQEFADALRLAAAIEDGMEKEDDAQLAAAQRAATIEPAAGEPTAQQLAAIEPAAGEAGAAGSNSAGGFGFQSSVTAVPLGAIDPIGPIGPTALQFRLPEFRDEVRGVGQQTGPVAPVPPGLETQNAQVYEDGQVTLLILGQTNAGPEVQLTVVISGIPSGWTVVPNNGGVFDPANGTVTYTLPPGTNFVGGPTLSPPADSDQDIPNLTITATNTDTVTGLTSTVVTVISVITDAVADAPNLEAQDTVGLEDQPVPVTINTSVNDTDGSEEITSVVITGVPDGFTLSAGTQTAPGEWTLTQGQLAGLTITAPQDYFGTISLTVVSTATEVNKTDLDFDLTNDNASTTATFNVTWQPVADTPDLLVNGGVNEVRVKEDGSVDVAITAAINPVDSPDAFLTVTVEGIDASWNFSAPVGTYDAAAGTWTWTGPAGTNLSTVMTFAPPADSDIDLNGLIATVVATEPATNTTASADGSFYVVVDAVADTPTINADNGTINEGQPIAVNLSGAVTDTDGSEIITGYEISGVPAGFTFSAGTQTSPGVWSFTPAEIVGLTATAPANYFGTINLTATVFNTENPVSDGEYDFSDNDNSASQGFTLTWKPVVDTPDIVVNNGADFAIVKEDGTVDVPVVANLGANGSPNEILTVTVTGISPDWGFSAPVGTYNAATGVWTWTGPAGTNLSTVLTFAPPADSDVDLNGLNATAQAYEPATNSYAFANDGFGIIVDAVADAPTLTAQNATGEEGRTVPLTITTAVTDTDGSEVIEKVVIEGLPPGTSLTAGTETAPGVWELSVDDLPGLAIVIPDGVVGVFNLTVTSTALEQNLSGQEVDFTDNRASTTTTLRLKIKADDVPIVTDPAAKTVDETNLSGGNLVVGSTITVDFGSDGPGTFAINGGFFSGVPLTSGGVAVDITQNGNGYVGSANGNTIFTLTINPDTGAFVYTQMGTLDHPDTTDPDDVITLQFGFTAHDNDGDSADGVITINVRDDAPIARDDVNTYQTVDGGAVGNVITGLNGGPGAADTLSQDGSTTVTKIQFGATIVDVPTSGTVTINGTHGALTIAADGSYEYTLFPVPPSGGTIVVQPHDFTDTLTFPALTEGKQISGSTLNNLGVKAGDLTVAANGTGTVTFVSEGAGYDNTLGMYTVAADGTLQAASVIIKNGNAVSPGFTANFAANAGETLGFFIVADGHKVNGGYAGLDFSTGTLSFVYKHGTVDARPANIADNGADVKLVFTSAGGVETVLKGAVYHTTERGDTNNLNADGTVRVVSGLADASDSQTLRIGFEDLPALGDKDYEDIIFDITFTGTTIVPGVCPEDVFTYVIVDGDGDTSTATLTMDGICPPVVVDIEVGPGAGGSVVVKEDGSIFVPISAVYTGGNGNETMTLTINGVGAGWGFTGGEWTATGTPGQYTLTLAAGDRDYNGGFTLAPPADSDVDLDGLTVTATVTGPDAGDNDSATDGVLVVVDAVIDTPTLTVAAATGKEGSTVALNIATAPGDLDGSEVITKITIGGLPIGATLNNGTVSGGVWTLSTADLAGLTVTLPNGSEGTYKLTVTTYAKEQNLSGIEVDYSDNETSLTKKLNLTVTYDDQPIVTDPVKKTVDETNLSSGHQTVSGTINVDYGRDNPGAISANDSFSSTVALTSGGVAVDVVRTGNVYTGTAGGKEIFVLTVNANGSYSFVLKGTLDHPDKTNHNDAIDLRFGFTATDADGDTATGTITVRVLDDGVVARDDFADYVVGGPAVNGNVLTNDTLSQDLANKVTKVAFGSTVVDVPSTGTATIEGQYGTLTIKADGSYTYTPKAGAGTPATGGMATLYLVDATTGVKIAVNATSVAGGVQFNINLVQGQADLNGFFLDIGGDGGPYFSIGSPANNMNGASNGFDYGFVLGSIGGGDADVTQAAVTIDGLTLADLVNAKIGIRATSVGTNGEDSLKLVGDVTVTVDPQDCPTDEFTYTLTDGDGDSSSAVLKLKGMTPLLVVGENTPDIDGSSTSFRVGDGSGKIVGGAAGDILIGDVGGSYLSQQNKDYNIVLVLDVSGSMGSGKGSRLEMLMNSVKNLLNEFNAYEGGTVKVHIVPFSTNALSAGTFTVTNDAELQQAINFLNGIPSDGWTNYEAALQSAINYLNGGKTAKPIAGAENLTYFISDGEPNYYLNNSGQVVQNTNANTAMNQIRGTDGTNEIAMLQALSHVVGVGINIGNGIFNLAEIATGDTALNITNAAQLTAALSALNPINQLVTSGDDVIEGGAGNDIIFGDSVNTDILAAAQGLDTRPGEGWAVFEKLEAGQGLNAAWTRADTISYIRNNLAEVARESLDAEGNPRAGGNDTIHGGAGDDIIFGQNGNDTIYGGDGDDYIDGGSGDDVIYGGAGNDFIDGGAGNDIIYGGDGDDIIYGWTGDDVIYGGDGDDHIVGEAGNNTLYGGAGADTFWYLNPQPGLDTIKDFNVAEGDRLELSQLLKDHYDPLQDAIDSFVFTRTEGGSTVVSVDLTGSGNAANAVDITVLEGISTSLQDLINSNSIVTSV